MVYLSHIKQYFENTDIKENLMANFYQAKTYYSLGLLYKYMNEDE